MSEARLTLSAVDQTRAAIESVKSNLHGLHTQAVSVAGALTGLGAAAWVAGVVAGVRTTLNEWDELGKAAQRVGLQSAQAMAEFEYAAKLAGVGTAGLETALGKLSSKMADAAGGNREAQRLFGALGVSIKDATGQLRATDAVLGDLAGAFASWKDGPEKSALALEIFGKAGKELIPLLNGGKQGLEDLRKEFRELRGELSDETAKAAEQFNDSLTKLQVSAGRLSVELSGRMLESLNQITLAMVEQAKRGNLLLTVYAGLAEFAKIASKTDTKGQQIRNVEWLDREIKSKAAQLELLTEAKNVGGDSDGKLQARIDALRASLQRLQQEALSASAAVKKAFNPTYQDEQDPSYAALESRRLNGRSTKPAAPIVSGKGTKEAASEYQKLNEELSRTLDLQKAEWEWGGKLDEVRRFEVDALAKITAKTSDLTSAQQVSLRAKVQETAEQMRANNLRDASFKQTMDQAKQIQEWRAKDHADSLQAIKDIDAEAAARIRALDGRITELRDDAEATELSARLNVSLAEAVEMVAIARLRERQERMVEGGEAWQNVEKEIEKRTQLLGLLNRKSEFDKHLEMWRSIDQTAHDVWTNIWEGGSNVFKRLGQTLKASLLDLLYQMTVRKWIISIGASIGVPGAAMAQSALGNVGGSALGSLLGGGSSFFGGLGSELMSGTLLGNIGAGMAGVGGSFASTIGAGLATDAMGATVFEGAAAATLGSGSGIGAALAAIPGWGWAAMAAAAVAGLLANGGETRVGGQFSGTTFLGGPSGGQINGAQALLAPTIAGINATLAALGSTAQLANLASGLEQSTKGKGFAYAGGVLTSGQVFGQGIDGQGFMNRRGSMTDQEALAAFQEELAQVKLEAVQASDAVGPLADWVRSLGDISLLTGQSLATAVSRLDKATSEKQMLEARLFDLTSTEAEKLLKARQAEISATDETNLALLRQVHAQEDLKAKAEELKVAAEALAAVAAERTGLERELMQLTGDIAGLRALELDALDASNRAIKERIYSLQDEQALMGKLRTAVPFFLTAEENKQLIAEEIATAFNQQLGTQVTPEFVLGMSADDYKAAYMQFVAEGNTLAAHTMIDLAEAFQSLVPSVQDVAARAEALAQQRSTMEAELARLNGDLAPARALELAAMDASLRPLQEMIWSREKELAVLAEREGLQMQIWQLQGREDLIRAALLEKLDPTNRALQEQVWALQDAAEAERDRQEALRNAAEAARRLRQELGSLADGMLEEARRIRGVDRTPAQLHAEFAVLAARAQAGDRTAMALLPQAGGALAASAVAQSATLADARLLRARTANTLELTAQFARAMADPVVAEVRQLREENKKLRDQQDRNHKALEALTRRTVTVFEGWDKQGMPPERAA